MKRTRRLALVGCVSTVIAMVAATTMTQGTAAGDSGLSEREIQQLKEQAQNPKISIPTAINTGATALQLAQAMAFDPSQITGASFVAKPPAGTPVGVADTSTSLSGFPLHGTTYSILTSGDANLAPTANSSNSSGTSDSGPNIRGNTDYDVTILKVDISVPFNSNCLSVGYFKFLSEEFPEYVGTQFNDAFIAELDVSNWTTSGSVISAPNNFAFDPNGDVISINAAGATSMSASQASGTTYDGATQTLIASTPITPGNHSIYFSIFDQGDHIFDSAVFLDNLQLKNATPGSCVSGALAPLTTSKTADSSVSSPGATNGYTITIHNPNSSPVQVATIYDDLPSGFSYQSGSTSGVTSSNPAIAGQTLTWTGPFTVPPNSSISLHFLVTVSSTPGTYDNDAGGTANGAVVTPVNNTAPITINAGTILDAYPAVLEVDAISVAYTYNLRAKLTTTLGVPLGGKMILFTNSGAAGGGFICSAVTNAIGEATCAGTTHAATITANLGYTATFAGDASYSGSSDHGSLTRVMGTNVP